MKKVDFLPQFNGFGIADEEWQVINNKFMPVMMLGDDDYSRLGCEQPKPGAPVIGMVFSREDAYYSAYWDYVLALAKTGVRILFLDYYNHISQLALCDALLLPGGSILFPERYYTDAKPDAALQISNRAKAYIDCYSKAVEKGLPVLGICTGMQVMAAESGFKLFRSLDCFRSPYSHKQRDPDAHHVDLTENMPLRELLGKRLMLVNSRHNTVVAYANVQRKLFGGNSLPLDIYATATDNIPEAVGKMDRGLLGIQWHPENLAAQGDKVQQLIFEWLAYKATEYKLSKKAN